MSEEDKEKRELATSRLLDLLRAQQAGAPEEGEEAEVPADEIAARETPAIEEVAEGELVEEAEEPPETGEELAGEPEAEPKTESLLEALKPVEAKAAAAAEAEGEEELVAEAALPETGQEEAEAVVSEALQPQSEDGGPEVETKDLLHEIQKRKPAAEREEEAEIEPEEFNSALLSTLSREKAKRTVRDYVWMLFHLFNESRRRVAIHVGDQFLRLLQIKTGFRRTEIEKFAEYSLPYEADGETINDIDRLLVHVLVNESDPKQMKYAYGCFFASKIETKTHILQTPKLKKKELNDLVEWNAKKNIPFSPDQAIIDCEALPATGNSEKQSVVIGISESESIESMISLFKDSKLKPRFFSTLAVLLWKLFNKNYPDRKSGCHVLIHLGERQTTIAVVADHKLMFTREIAMGAEDFYEAARQRVVMGEESIEIDYSMAKQLLHDYGIPRQTRGVSKGSRISLYKISIFLRPVVERLTGELTRSLDYFKKQNPDLEWNELLLDGIGATFPHLPETIGENLNLKVGLLNPMRNGQYHFRDGAVLLDRALPSYAVNFALASAEAGKINVIPKKLRSDYKYIFLYKVAAVAVAFFLPVFIGSTILSGMRIDRMEAEVAKKTKMWNRLSVQAKEYFGFVDDMEVLGNYRRFLDNDRKFSRNQIKLLKIFSSIVPSDIKLTQLKFSKEIEGQEQGAEENRRLVDVMTVSGFVAADPSVADIKLTNFVVDLKQLDVFSRVDVNMDEPSNPEEGKLFFTLNFRF